MQHLCCSGRALEAVGGEEHQVGGDGKVNGGNGTGDGLGVDDAGGEVGNSRHLACDGGGEEDPSYA